MPTLSSTSKTPRLTSPGKGDSSGFSGHEKQFNEQDCQASQLQTEKDYFTTEPLSREPVSTVKVLFNPGLFEAKCLQMSKIVLNCFEI